ncbi:hypothetical protein BCR44DRAFT_34673, partial [Catenaria anguillulae PL171]
MDLPTSPGIPSPPPPLPLLSPRPTEFDPRLGNQLPYLTEELWAAIASLLDHADRTVFAATCHRFWTLIYATPTLWLSMWTTRQSPPPEFARLMSNAHAYAASGSGSASSFSPTLGLPPSRMWCLDLQWMDACPRHVPVLVSRLDARRVRPLVRAVWLPFLLAGTVDVVGTLSMFPNLATISGDASMLAECFSQAVMQLRASPHPPAMLIDDSAAPSILPHSPTVTGHHNAAASLSAATAKSTPNFPLPSLQRIYLNDEPAMHTYTLLSSVLPHMTPHPHPLSMTLCLQCHRAVHPFNTDHTEFGCPVTGCLACVPQSECMKCGNSFCAPHLVPIASLCPRALAQNVADNVCAWCAAGIARCDTCGALDCPHCETSGASTSPTLVAPTTGAAAENTGAGDGTPSKPVAKCSKCLRTQCGACCRTYFCGRCSLALCDACVTGCVCLLCDSDVATCLGCFLDVHLARDDMYVDLPRVCDACEFPFCASCRDSHECRAFQLFERMARGTGRVRAHLRRVREERRRGREGLASVLGGFEHEDGHNHDQSGQANEPVSPTSMTVTSEGSSVNWGPPTVSTLSSIAATSSNPVTAPGSPTEF